jgi:hypothetical protein
MNEIPVYDADQAASRRGCFFFTPAGCILGGCLGIVFCVCFGMIGVVGGSTALVAMLMTNTATTSQTQTYPLDQLGSLEIREDNATVTIRGAAVEEITITYKLTTHGLSDGMAQNNLKATHVIIDQQGGNFSIRVDDSSAGFNIYDLDLTITVPYKLQNITIVNDEDVTISDVQANFELVNGFGDVQLQNVRGVFDVQVSAFSDIVFSGELFPNAQHQFIGSDGDIRMTLTGLLNVEYRAQADGRTVTCPSQTNVQVCSGRLGDATAKLTVSSKSGTIILLTE